MKVKDLKELLPSVQLVIICTTDFEGNQERLQTCHAECISEQYHNKIVRRIISEYENGFDYIVCWI